MVTVMIFFVLTWWIINEFQNWVSKTRSALHAAIIKNILGGKAKYSHVLLPKLLQMQDRYQFVKYLWHALAGFWTL